ncbi:FAD/NAD(P)-binding oxidoreductase [Amycolatopsis endophytica]|uniref:NADPH-dependent 2,4-dienoyl-CoA reductase/sulfur reductase-like enzyme n=1 Tax=Amycolatopsis endophytica TaxID=860233 RepID=A0A853B951_9PSEU|nr:FAD-dependent oxidoreductase [Amycolatopsis endophytica]NYI91669.1 NADPH-dependent 2,4-dienoyl-CoA reductase/sulfur reductase-like enzyme [Amycolatopsis endophytica]
MNRVVVVGGSLAGVNAADELRARGFEGELVLAGAERHLPYTRPPLSKAALADGLAEDVFLRDPRWYAERDITLKLGCAATGLDTRARLVAFEDGTTEQYDGLVIATGSAVARAVLPGSVELRDLDDAQRLIRLLSGARSLLVVGAGFVGLETAATARGLGLDVTVVDVAQTPMSRVLGHGVGAWLQARHEERGVRVLCSTGITGLSPAGSRTRAELSTGEVLTVDVVLVATGARPATAWLGGSEVPVADGVVCEPTLAAGVPGVVAAGDVARWHNALFGETMRVEHWTNAVEQGIHAAGTLLGDARPFESVPYFWSDQFEAKLRCVGRPLPGDETEVLVDTATKLVVVYGREGLLRGAVCVNAPRKLASLRQAIAERTSFDAGLVRS